MSFTQVITATDSLAKAFGGDLKDPAKVFTSLRNAALEVKDATSDLKEAFNAKDFERIQNSTNKIIDILENKTIQQKDFKALVTSVGKVSLCIIKLVLDAISGNIPGVVQDVVALIPELKNAYVQAVAAIDKFTIFWKETLLPALKEFGNEIDQKIIVPIKKSLIDPIKEFFHNKSQADIQKLDFKELHSKIDFKLVKFLDSLDEESYESNLEESSDASTIAILSLNDDPFGFDEEFDIADPQYTLPNTLVEEIATSQEI